MVERREGRFVMKQRMKCPRCGNELALDRAYSTRHFICLTPSCRYTKGLAMDDLQLFMWAGACAALLAVTTAGIMTGFEPLGVFVLLFCCSLAYFIGLLMGDIVLKIRKEPRR